jgi:ERCC4-type nuclease
MESGIVVDCREKRLLEILDGSATVQQLPVGDVLLSGTVLLERKTACDLAASIKDGRWHDQLARMRQFCSEGEDRRAAVVVEGLDEYRAPSSCIPTRSLYTALYGALVRDGVAFFETRDTEETAELCRRLSSVVESGKPPSAQAGAPALRKRGSLFDRPEEVAKAQLRVVPGVSARIATELMRDFGTLFEFVSHWNGRDAELADKIVGSRRLGAALAGRILAALCPRPPKED